MIRKKNGPAASCHSAGPEKRDAIASRWSHHSTDVSRGNRQIDCEQLGVVLADEVLDADRDLIATAQPDRAAMKAVIALAIQPRRVPRRGAIRSRGSAPAPSRVRTLPPSEGVGLSVPGAGR